MDNRQQIGAKQMQIEEIAIEDIKPYERNAKEIADTLGISKTIVNKMCCKTYKPYISNARYFSDIIREADWFEQI